MSKEKFLQDLQRQLITTAAASVQRASAKALNSGQAFVYDAKADVLLLAQRISLDILRLQTICDKPEQDAKR